MEFKYAKTLKKKFDVFGHYYQLDTGNEIVQCRSRLYLTDKAAHHTTELDAIVCMMNPGLSRTVDQEFVPPVLTVNDLANNLGSVKETQPDTTQYQIMRVMLYKAWKNVLVINLSDIRNPKSQKFASQVKSLKSDVHSIWSQQRRKELDRILQNRVPVIIGWGKMEVLRAFAENGLKLLSNHNIYGVPFEGSEIWYKFPSPPLQTKKEEWLRTMARIL